MRTYARKTGRGQTSLEEMHRAADLVTQNGQSIRSVAKALGICRVSLNRFIQRRNTDPDTTFGYRSARRVFNDEEETALNKYLIQSAQIYFGLTPKEVRRLAYECAVQYNKDMPESWRQNKQAGADWFAAFLKRNPRLSIRTPEATSLGRATSFNKKNVTNFFYKLNNVLERYSFTASSIWNTDETGVSTVLKPPKVVGVKGSRQVGALTSGERGTNVTLTTAVSASGLCIPPMFLFPRKNYKDYFIRGGPPDCIGTANSSGWMTEDSFLLFMRHFIKHVKPKKQSPVLLLLDNHSSHLAISVLNLAKDNGIVLLSFPPHCSHRLQPLDVGVYGPFKKYLSSAQDAWMRSNAGKNITIYDIPSIVNSAYPLAMCPNNIINAFKKSGIFPYNPDVFSDIDFAPAYVTDRPVPPDENDNQGNQLLENEPQVVNENPQELISDESSQQPNENSQHPTLNENDQPQNKECKKNINNAENPTAAPSNIDNLPGKKTFSPHIVKPLPKAGPRTGSTKGRKRRYTAVLTDTPEKDALEQEQATISQKKMKQVKQKAKQVKRKVFSNKKNQDSNSSTDSEDDCVCLICCDSYSQSLPSEEWVQCRTCKEWAHDKCITGDSKWFICLNCDSDMD